ncbi:uncharacterized protein LOC123909295 [Trifolium pratense]|uniref:uncharacterized protein LOC123909295 n=1 Tax=Trifolium pratense TaxID=57577 RepID=UPI001E692F9B|nr:uncharacterized protein LOC123909295 [Trifolium pratense]XP_045816072.1 uncharacterized protein LOC123909295 [Trifolium pratense]
MTAESPRKDCQSQDILLTKWFLNACMFYYGNRPRSQENQEKQFVSKHINIIDPLRLDNNLGRSISKGSFYRIRSAFSLGAERMVRLLNCTEEYLIAEFDFFFKNTWNRHGNGYWIHVSIYNRYIRKVRKLTWQESEDEQAQASNKSRAIYQKPDNQLKESNQSSDACVVSQTQNSSPESAPIYSEAQNQHCNVFVSDTESELVHFSSSMSDSKMGSTSRSEVLDNLSFGPTSCDLRSENAVKSKNASNMELQKEEPDCSTITKSSSRSLHTLKPPQGQNLTINVGKDSVDPPAVVIKHGSVMNSAESCKYTPALESTSETNLSSLPPETTKPENVHGQSTVSSDTFRNESATSESVALNVHALQSPCASGSSVLQFPFKFNNISHVDILYGDFESYWANLKYGQHCVNGHSEEPVYFPPTVELPMDFQAQYYWNTRPSSSVNGVPLVVPGMPPTLASDSQIEGINQGVSFWLPGSSGGTGTFMPNPLTYHERNYVEEFYNEHQNANNISERQEDSNFNSRGRSSISDYRQPRNLNSNSRERFSSRGQNHYRRNEISEGKKEAPHQGEGEVSSSAVNEFENLEKDSKDNSP